MLTGKNILITGAARRLGREFALACAAAGANIILHHSNSASEAAQTALEIQALGRNVHVVQADFSKPQAVQNLIDQIWPTNQVDILVNSAAVFENLTAQTTDLTAWQTHLDINLTAPFLLSQAFARHYHSEIPGRIVNILDWRALRPGIDHFPYTISKAALAAMTRSLAVSFAPQILVNAVALGAILPPADGSTSAEILQNIPVHRWANLPEVMQTLLFLIDGPEYITGEIIHVDGGRHLV